MWMFLICWMLLWFSQSSFYWHFPFMSFRVKINLNIRNIWVKKEKKIYKMYSSGTWSWLYEGIFCECMPVNSWYLYVCVLIMKPCCICRDLFIKVISFVKATPCLSATVAALKSLGLLLYLKISDLLKTINNIISLNMTVLGSVLQFTD